MKSINYMNSVSEVANANGEAIKSMYMLSLEAAQKLGELNGEMVRSFVDNVQKIGATSDAEERVKVQAQLFERSSDYFRELTDVFSSTMPEIGRLNAQRMNAVMDMMAEQAQQLSAAKRKSERSADMAELMKSSFFNPAVAYENMFNMTQQLFDSSLQAVGQKPAGKAVARASEEGKKAA